MKRIKSFFDREQNLLFHIIATIFVIIFSILFNLNLTEYLFIFFAVVLVITSELINSSIELTVDLYTKEFNPLAMVAKDTAAAAVLVSALTAAFIGLYIFLPKILTLIKLYIN